MAFMENQAAYKWLARGIGLALLLAFALAAYEGFVLGGDALATSADKGRSAFLDVLGTLMLFDAIGVGLTMLVAIGFFILLRPINPGVSFVAGVLRFVPAGFTGAGLYGAYGVWGGLQGAAPTDTEALNEIAERLQGLDFDFFHWGLIAASASAILVYALLFAGRLIPRLIAGYGVVASIGAIVGASSIYLAPTVSEIMFPAYVAANAIAYVSLMLWLILFGVNTDYWHGRSTQGSASLEDR